MGTRDAAAPRSPKGTTSPPSRTARGGPETPQNLPACSFAAHVPASGHSAQPRRRTAGRRDAATLRSIRARQGAHPRTAANTRHPPPRRRAGRQGAPCRSFPSEPPSPRRAMHSPFSSRRPPTPILPQARARGNLPNLCGQRCPRERERIGCPLFHDPFARAANRSVSNSKAASPAASASTGSTERNRANAGSVSGAISTLQLKQTFLHTQSAAVADKRTGAAYDTMARDNDRNGVPVVRHAHGPAGLRIADRLRRYLYNLPYGHREPCTGPAKPAS